MKKLVKFTILSIFMVLFISHVDALSVSKNNLTIEKGGSDKVELYANSDKEITRVEFTLIYMSNDVPAYYSVGSGLSDSNPNGIKHNISLGEAKSGKILLGTVNINVKNNPEGRGGSINIHSAKGYTSDEEEVSLNSQSINVTIGTPVNNQEEVKKEEPKEEKKEEEEKKEIDKNLLDKIESKLVKIELKKDVFEYKVVIDEDIKELDLKAIPKDEKTKVEISTQKIDEIKDNKIIITASNEDIKQEYVIYLSLNKEIEVTVDKSEFKENGSYKGKWIIASIVLIVILMVGLVLTKKK